MRIYTMPSSKPFSKHSSNAWMTPMRILLLSNALEMLAVALVLPAYPAITKSLGISLQTRGLMVSLFSLLQFISSPVLGRGFFKCGISVSQAYISDISTQKDRAKNLGVMGSMFGLAFIVGPALGGIMMGRDPWLTVWVALFATILNLLILLSLPEPPPPAILADEKHKKDDGENVVTQNGTSEIAQKREKATTDDKVNGNKSDDQGVWYLVRHSPKGGQVVVLLGRKVFVAMSSGIFETSFANYASKHLGLDGQTLGLILSFLGVISVLNNVVIVRWLSNRFQDHQLIFPAIVGQALSMLGWAYVYNIVTLLPVLAGLTVSGSIFQTLLSTELSEVTPHALVGTVLGVSYAIETFAKILTPFLGGYLLEQYGGHALGFAATCFLLPVCANVALADFRRGVAKEEDKKIK
ncbi:major facilitator subfamily protein [Nannochloropsis oceanica]